MQNKKVALVTGGGAGIGRSVAMAFSKAMIRVAVVDIQVEEGKKTVEMIRSRGGEAFFIKADVTNQDDARNMVEKTVKIFGRLDHAFNNTNFAESQSVSWKMKSVNLDYVIGMNLIGIWLCMKYEVIEMLKNKQGSIVNLASITAKTGFLNNSIYMQAVNTWTKTAALEYTTYGLRVNAVCADLDCAEAIDTSMTGERENTIPVTNSRLFGSMQTAEQIASAVIWLSSDSASLITGYPLVLDHSSLIREYSESG